MIKSGPLSPYADAVTKKSAFVFAVLMLLAFCIFLNQAGCRELHSDLGAHIRFIKDHFERGARLDHPFFHYVTYYTSQLLCLNLVGTAIGILTISVVVSALIIFFLLRESLRTHYSENCLLFLTFSLMILSAVYVPFFNKFIYIGQSSPNVWHNPTTIVVKPFAFISVILFLSMVRMKDTKKPLLFLLLEAGLIAISVTVKPNFFMSFLPAAGIFLLVRYSLFKENIWKLVIILAPALAILIWQYFLRFGEGGQDRIVIDILGVWSHYSPNVFVSLLLLIAFPLSVLVFYPREVLKNDSLVLSWLIFLMALLQYSLFAEAGHHRNHGNFGWGRQIILPLVFTFSSIVYLKAIREKPADSWGTIKKNIVVVCFASHVISGIAYLVKMFITRSFF